MIRRASVRLPKWHGADHVKPEPRLWEPGTNSVTASRHPETKPDAQAGSALELVRQRSAPAMFIVGPGNSLLYANEQTLKIFRDPNSIPAEVQALCNRVRIRTGGDTGASFECAVFSGPGGDLYSFRAFPVQGQEDASAHVMVLVEKVVERGPINLKKAKACGLSDREIEVVKLVAQGLCNKEIGAKLYVSEYTVKGHLKNITRKVGAESRGSIIAILK